MATAKYRRILLKLSGESLQGKQNYGHDVEVLNAYAQEIKQIKALGVEIGIVIGGGNIFRGIQGAGRGFDRVKGDQMGMLATIINSLALQSALESQGVKTKVLTSIRMEPIGELRLLSTLRLAMLLSLVVVPLTHTSLPIPPLSCVV